MVQNFFNKLSGTGQKLSEALLGKKINDIDSIDLSGIDTNNPYFAENSGLDEPQVKMLTQTTPERQGGILPDMMRGYRENYNNAFDVNNIGQNKGWATRLGEGLGTVGRIIDSPLGRGLLAAGLNSALGYNNSLQEGLTAAVGRQQAKAANDLYRKSLEEQGLDTSNIGGNITDKMYQNYALANYRNRSLDAKMQLGMLKDNTSRAKMINAMLTNGMISPAEAMERMAEYGIKIDNLDESNQTKLLPYRQYALQVAPQIAMGNLGVAQGNLALNQQKFLQGEKPTLNNTLALANHFDSLPEVKNFKEIDRQFNNVKNVYDDYKAGKLRANASDQAMITTLNKILDPTSVVRESEFARTAQGQAMLAKIEGYAKKITRGGSGLTDKERQDLFNSMQTMRNAAYNTFSTTAKNYTDMALRYGINPQDIIRYGSEVGQSNNAKDNSQVITKLKNAGYSDEKIQQYLKQKGLL